MSAAQTQPLEDVDVNRSYFVWYVSSVASRGSKVLDFGCGSGTVVHLLREAGYEAYGVDIKDWGLDPPELSMNDLPEGALRYYPEGGPLPFEDATFDVVISDMVLEHVVTLEAAVLELERVLKPDGVMYHHFPSRTVLREDTCPPLVRACYSQLVPIFSAR